MNLPGLTEYPGDPNIERTHFGPKTLQWVRLIGGRKVLTWANWTDDGWRIQGTRSLTFRERIAHYWLRRTPKP
jgi:hypothetical protein